MHRGRRLFPLTAEQQQLLHRTDHSAEAAQETVEKSNDVLQEQFQMTGE